MDKLMRICTEDPVVPLGASFTVFFLFAGLKYMKNQNQYMSQLMMRGRVASQAITVVACVYAIGRRELERNPPTKPTEKS